MDVVLDVLDTYAFDRLYSSLLPASQTQLALNKEAFPTYNQNVGRYVTLPASDWATQSSWARDDVRRQAVSLFFITWFFGLVLYFIGSTISYNFVFDKRSMNHPKFLRNQLKMEVRQAMEAMPVMSALTTPFFVGEVRGYTKLYDSPSEAPFPLYNLIQFPLFMAFTDFCIYWIHRGLHHPLVYRRLHKPHHKWIVPTPYASYAFHPVDGWSQSVPYHLFPFLFPLQKVSYLGLFVFVTIWTVLIHDGEYATRSPVINGSACHTLHHLYFNYNYGQFFTLWDRIGGSYRVPPEELFNDELKMDKKEWEKQSREAEKLVKEVEGTDDRMYEGKKDL